MNATAQKVVSLNDTSVFDTICTFIERRYKNSGNTGDAYQRDIKLFFSEMRNKEIKYLTHEDLKFKLTDIERYQMSLFDGNDTRKPMTSKTVKRKIDSVKSLYEYLKANDFDVNPSWFKVSEIKEDDSKSWGVLQWDEIKKMIELCQDMNNGEMKGLLIELACVTSFRISALINIMWDKDFEKIGDTWVVYGLDKGKKKIRKSITEDLYNRIQKMRKTLEPDERYVFPIHRDSVNDLIHKLIKIMNINPNRNIVFHSFKKTGIAEVYMATNGDILSIKQQGNHESEQTTIASYLELSDDPSKDPSLLVGQQIDLSEIKELTPEQVYQIVMDCDRSVQMVIANKLKSLV